jgi:hypothetical protein
MSYSQLYAQNDEKLTDLDAIASPALTDVMYIVDDPSGTPASKKITVGNVLGVGNDIDSNGDVTVTAADISDQNAGTDITADLEEETHASEHESGGADAIDVSGLTGADEDDVTDDDIDDLQNVAIASHVNAQILIYQSATDDWKNKTVSGDATLGADGALTLANDCAGDNEIDYANVTLADFTDDLGEDPTHTHTTSTISGLDISADTNLTAGDHITLTDDDLDVDDDFLLNTGDAGTGAYDFGGADSLEVPNGAAPTVDATGEMAVDTDCITQGMLIMYAASAKVYTVATTDTPADNEIPKYDSASGTITWEADASGSGSGLWRLDLPIQSGKLGGADITNPMAIDGGDRPWEGLFDDSTDEEVVWQFVMGNDYAGGDILVTIVFSCATTQSGDKDVEFDAKFMATTPSSDSEDFNSDGYDSVQTVDHDLATDQTAGYPRVAQITFTVTQADEIAAGDICRFHLMRDVSTTDDATDDVEVLGVILEEQS